MVRIIVALASLALAGCAWQTEVLEIGADKYQVSANASPARGATTGARGLALAKANKKCQSLGRQIDVVDVETGYAFPANGTATVTFYCR